MHHFAIELVEVPKISICAGMSNPLIQDMKSLLCLLQTLHINLDLLPLKPLLYAEK